MLEITLNGDKKWQVEKEDHQWMVNGNVASVDIIEPSNGLISIIVNGKSYTAIIEKTDRGNKEVTISINNKQFTASIKEPIDQLLSNMGLDLQAMKKAEPVKAPMPGMVLRILVEPGQKINKGDGLLVLEAMKMENLLKATGPATVKAIRAVEKTAVEKGSILIELE